MLYLEYLKFTQSNQHEYTKGLKYDVTIVIL